MDFDFLATDNEITFKKLSQADDWYNSPSFSLLTSNTASAMDIEYISTDFQSESFSGSQMSQMKKAEAPSSQNHSKDSLKFARRITKSCLQFLKQDADGILKAFLDCGSQLIACQAAIVDVKIIDNERLMKDSLNLIKDVWYFFSKNLSCTYNKKISKVTKDLWDIVFSEEGFWKAAKEAETTLQMKDYFSQCGEVEAEMIRTYFKKVLFLVNKGLVIVHLNLKKAEKVDFYENIPTFENYIVLSLVPSLFDAYNHKQGVFVDECCRSCKVCQSKMADKSIPPKIKTAWEFATAFAQNFESYNTSQSIQDPSNILNIVQFLTILDDTIASLSR